MTDHEGHCSTVRSGHACTCGADTAATPDQMLEQIASAYLDYRDRVTVLCRDVDPDVMALALAESQRMSVKPDSPARDKYVMFSEILEREIIRRAMWKRADEAFKNGALAYCVFHGGDMAQCPEGSHD